MYTLLVIFFFFAAQGLERRMSFKKNPGCESYNMSLYYLKAEGPNDTLHYIWDFTYSKKPTIFLALTDIDDSLMISCWDFVGEGSKVFNFTKNPKYEFFLVMNELIEFNDVNDTGILTAQTPRISYDTKNFAWVESEEPKVDDQGRFVTLKIRGSYNGESHFFVSGNVSIQLTAFGFENHDNELPKLLHSPNSTQCKIILENLSSDSGFNESRYAVSFILVSSDDRNNASKITTRKNLDDENSPGIFSMVDLITPKAQNQLFEGAFLQWRPVIYTSRLPSLSNSSETVAYNLTEVIDPVKVLKDNLPYKYYGQDLDSVLVERTVVSFGTSEDGFYTKSNFSSWTFLVNFGSPEEEKFSLLVVLVMCIGLGLPAFLILTGGIYMCARRIKRNKDELSLERVFFESRDPSSDGYPSTKATPNKVRETRFVRVRWRLWFPPDLPGRSDIGC